MSMKDIEHERYGTLIENAEKKFNEKNKYKRAEFECLVDSKVQTALERYSAQGANPGERKKTYDEIWKKINELEKEINNLKLEMYKTMDSVH